jgi:hypothetical protein
MYHIVSLKNKRRHHHEGQQHAKDEVPTDAV